jgi:hypothetical protein
MEPVATEAAPAAAINPRVAPRPARVRATWRLALRIAITLHALAVLVQVVFAGRFMAGDFEFLDAHFVNSQVVGGLGLAQLALGFLYWRPGGGRLQPALACLAVSIAEPLQIAAGILRVIGVHVPLGVLVFAASAFLTGWAWGPTFGNRR